MRRTDGIAEARSLGERRAEPFISAVVESRHTHFCDPVAAVERNAHESVDIVERHADAGVRIGLARSRE
jgi:hypothetical protein